MTRRHFTPREYQVLMLQHMLEHPRNAVWASMGMGKTVGMLTALDSLHLAGDDLPTLILAPKRVALDVWPKEAQKWGHLRHATEVVPVIGTEKERLTALRRDAPVFSINYDNLEWLVKTLGDRWPFDKIVADEATRLKSLRLSYRTSSKGKKFLAGQGGKRAAALGRVAHTGKVKRFIQLTGTPAPNGLKDLWGQLWFLDAGERLGRTHTAFMQRWFEKGYDGFTYTARKHAQEEIQGLLADICLTLDAEDWFDLEKPQVANVYVDLPPKARKLYDDMEKEMFAEIEEHPVEAFNAAVKTSKCLQLASGNVWLDRDAGKWAAVHDVKLDALESISEEANGEPVLVAYQWVPSLERILKRFPHAKFLDDDPRTEERWNAGEIPMLVAHPQSAGHGLNLQDGGRRIVFYDHWWNLEEYMQIIERLGPTRQHQAGRNRVVWVHHIIARKTADDMVMERRESKREVQEILLAAAKRRRV